MRLLNDRLKDFGTTIFAEMSALAVQTGSVNLGQGFPDTDGPAEVVDAAAEAVRAGLNQYPPGRGVPELLDAVAAHQQRWYGLAYDPSSEVLATTGATEAIAAAILALCEPGDEVLTFEPFYDSYPACIAMAGAAHRTVRMSPPDWGFDPADLRAAITPRTRLILVNTPHNPTGHVFTPEELREIAAVCVEHDLLAVTDEVYEHLVFDGRHVPLAGLPGMRERTITISSGGKTFSVTGWKVGWVCAPEPLVDAVRTTKQFLTYVNAAPFQLAVARGLGMGDAFFTDVAARLGRQRDLLCDGLAALGLTVHRPRATYFVTTDVSPVFSGDDVAFCRELPHRCGVVAIPVSVFGYQPGTHVRWAFCKRPAVLEEALRRLRA